MTTEDYKSFASDLRSLDRPAVFKGMIDQWPCRKWTLDVWAEKFNEKQIKFRIGPINLPKDCGPLWETDCHYIESTVMEFNHWQEGTNGYSATSRPVSLNEVSSTSLADFDPKLFWAYADYKHMAELFDHESDIHNCLDWSVFGFEGRKGLQSTIWIGSPNAHTPCHYDTYGCNLVAQLVGRKQWVLFPPSDTGNLYPTRIPYEESSIFSRVNISQPNTTTFPKFKAYSGVTKYSWLKEPRIIFIALCFTTPYVITLEEGDVLFVPPKWWHFVKSLSLTVSINSWIEMETDDDCRFEEAITRAVVSAYMPVYATDQLKWINPTEECTSSEINILYVRETLKKYLLNHFNEVKASLSFKISEADVTSPSTTCEEVPPLKIPRCLIITEEESEEMLKAPFMNARSVLESTTIKCQQEPTHGQILSQFHGAITLLESVPYNEYIQRISSVDYSSATASQDHTPLSVSALNNDCDLKINLLNAIVDPEVVSLICKKLVNTYIQNKC